MGGYFSSIKVDEANVTNATNDAEHDDVLVLTEKKVDPVELKNDESGLIALDDDKDKDIDKEKSEKSEKCDEFASRTTVNDVVYTKKNKKKNKKKKAKFLQ
jgi:hypothetical protein